MDDLRQANICILVAAVIAVVGVLVFRNAGDAALQLVGMAALIGAFVVHCVLDELTLRRNKKRAQ
jgi:hypothetical protein